MGIGSYWIPTAVQFISLTKPPIGVITGVLGSNLTYRTEDLRSREWFYEVDCSKYIAYLIAALNHDMSMSSLIDPHEKIENLLIQHGFKQPRA